MKKEIRYYDTEKEIKEDYERFRGDWTFDPDELTAEHKTGLKMARDFNHSGEIRYDNLAEWCEIWRQKGWTPEEIDDYRRTMRNQFYMLCRQEGTYQDPEEIRQEPTFEEAYERIRLRDEGLLADLIDQKAPPEIYERQKKRLEANREERAWDAIKAYRELHSELSPEEEAEIRQYSKKNNIPDEEVEDYIRFVKDYSHRLVVGPQKWRERHGRQD